MSRFIIYRTEGSVTLIHLIISRVPILIISRVSSRDAEGDPRDQRRQGVHRPQGPGHSPRPRQLRDLLRQVSGGAGGLHTKEDVYLQTGVTYQLLGRSQKQL